MTTTTRIPSGRYFLAFHRTSSGDYYALNYSGAAHKWDPTGAYRINKSGSRWVLTATVGSTFQERNENPARPLGTFKTLAAAKDAAQTDYFVPQSADDYFR